MPATNQPQTTGTTVRGGSATTSDPSKIGTSPFSSSAGQSSQAFDYNVCIVILDDVGLEKFNAYVPITGYTGQTIRIPNIRNNVQNRGVTFNRFLVCPTCGPTRACLSSGLLPHHSGHIANIPEPPANPSPPPPHAPPSDPDEIFYLGMDPTNITTRADHSRQLLQLLPTMLRNGRPNNVYKAAKFGKSHFSTERFYGYHSANEGWETFRGHQWNLASHFDYEYVTNDRDVESGESSYTVDDHRLVYGPAQENTDMQAWLDTVGDKPFLLWWAPSVGHSAYQSPPTSGVGAISANSVADWTNAFGGSYPAPGTNWNSTGSTDPTLVAKRVMTQKHAIESADEVFGRLVAKLQALGKYEKTVFIVFCDNGTSGDCVEAPFEVGHAKRFAYAGGTWTPLMIGGPVCGSAPRSSNEMVHVTDLEATIRAITKTYPAGIAAGDVGIGARPRDGVSILPHLRDPSVHTTRQLNFTMIGGAYPGYGWNPALRKYDSAPAQLSWMISDDIHTFVKQGSPNQEKLYLAGDFRQSDTPITHGGGSFPGNLLVTQPTNPVVIEVYTRLKAAGLAILAT